MIYSTELLGGVVVLIGVVGLRQADMRAVIFAPEAGPAGAIEPAASAGSVAALAPDILLGNLTNVFPTPPVAPSSPASAPPAAVVDPAVLARIRRALEEERLYLNPTLTLAELAAHTSLAPRLISFTINQGFGQNFNDLVNGYRVAEVKRRLATPDAQRLTLLGLALESGFNSKTTFNRIFKQLTGVAPRDWVSDSVNE